MLTTDQLQALAALPLHAILLGCMIVEGFAIRALFVQMRDIQKQLDDCLGKK